MRSGSEPNRISFDSVPPARNAERAMLDARVPDYQVVREIGQGGMGVVFLARDVRLHRLVAIKVLRHELACCEEQRERFRREARLTARLNDDGIVAVHGFDERDDLAYIVMEFVRGAPLGTRLRSQGRLAAEEARSILVSLARTLDHAHSRGIVHRDLKPENVLLDAETQRARLTDFGVALSRSMDALPSEMHRAYGTPHFMSPEQAAGETDLDGRSDIYSLGVLGYLMLSGRVPFEGDHYAAIASRQITEAHRPLRDAAPRAPAELMAVIERCLAKEPEQRWRRGLEVAEALSRPAGRLTGMRLVSSLLRSA
jgi:eukaryotic-like serine/threonine-protein kinase